MSLILDCMWRFFSVLIVAATCARVPAETPCTLYSSHDGNGLYTYTFDRGDAWYVWGFNPSNGAVNIRSFEVLEVLTPPNWLWSVNSNDVVTLSLGAGTVYFESPVSFSIRSASATASNYSFLTYDCLIVASAYDTNTHRFQAGGYHTFDHVGPVPALRLDIAKSGTNVVLKWPVTDNPYVLETATDLRQGSNAWTAAVTNSQTISGWQKYLTNAVTEPNRFYRLRREE